MRLIHKKIYFPNGFSSTTENVNILKMLFSPQRVLHMLKPLLVSLRDAHARE